MQTTASLLQKYNVTGPRYTSYPTALQFSERVNAPVFADHVNQQRQLSPLSLYIHIPFCADICYYCACNKKVTRDRAEIENYLRSLYREMQLVRQRLGVDQQQVMQLHWGGGTPTYLDAAEMTELMLVTARHFNLSNATERDYSVEIDPRNVDREKIELLRGLGFNRVSLGVQDFSLPVQQAINRIQPPSMVADLVAMIRERSFHSLNFDMIYGLPQQTLATLEKTLEEVIALRPDRINYYNYAHLPERFPSQRAIDRLVLPDASDKLQMLALIQQTLVAAGYIHLGMDNFVLADDSLAQAYHNDNLIRNFQGYSVAKADNLLGLGVSAISQYAGVYAQNHTDLANYYAAIDAGLLPTAKGCVVSEDDRRRAWVIQHLMCQRRLDIEQWQQQFKADFWEYFADSRERLNELINDGLLQLNASSLRVTEEGVHFLRNICMAFDRYLFSAPNAPSSGYSKTL